MNPTANVRLLDRPGLDGAGDNLADKLNIPRVNDTGCGNGLLLHRGDNGQLGIGFASELATSRGDIHQSSAWFYPGFNQRYAAARRDPLMRAVGYKTRTVLDCTAGWGVDAAHFAWHGISVTALERQPVVFALLHSALSHCNQRRLAQQLSIVPADSYAWLETLLEPVEVIYIDPMYPPKPGAAAPRRPLRILQALGKGDHQADQDSPGLLLNLARHHATRRVVVKRPHYAAPLDRGVSGSITAKLVRFDLYPPIRGHVA